MAVPRAAGYTGGGYRGYLARRGWQVAQEQDFTLGIFRDVPRIQIPPGGVYDSLDLLLHKPGVAFKRGGGTYAGPASAAGSKAIAVAYAGFPTGPQLLVLEDDFHLYKVTSGATTDVGTLSSFTGMVTKPVVFIGGTQNILVFPNFGGSTIPWYYDGTAVRQFQGGNPDTTGNYALSLTGSPSGGSFKLAIYAQPDPDAGGGTGLDTAAALTTGALAYNASAATIQTALETATGGYGDPTWPCTGGALPTAVTITVPVGWSLSYMPPGLSGVTLTGGTNPYGLLGPVGGTAAGVPTGRFAETHLQRLLLANSSLNGNRIWFGPVLNPASAAWDMANSWIDMDDNVSGLASLSHVLLVFSTRTMWQIVGDTPPPGSNMRIEPISEIGTTDARSIVTFGGQCIFANPQSVYITSGVAPVSLMQDRIESYWQGLFSGYDPASDAWTITSGLYGNRFLFVTVLNGNNLVQTLVCDLPRRSWMRMSQPVAKMYAAAYGASEELYACTRTNTRVVKLSGFFSPVAGNKLEADGSTAVTCMLETRPQGGTALRAVGNGHLSYDMRDAASDNPTLAVTVAPGVEATTYAAVAESPLAESTDQVRKRFTVAKDTDAVSVKLTQTNASSKTEIYALETEQRPYYPSDEGQ